MSSSGYRKIKPGHYESRDGRVTITRVLSMQTGRATESLWAIEIDGEELPTCQELLSDAKIIADKRLACKFTRS